MYSAGVVGARVLSLELVAELAIFARYGKGEGGVALSGKGGKERGSLR